jgi:hypothetical protein
VIKTHLHAYDNDSIGHDLDLFVKGCKSSRQYIESERNRTNLRLVCRSWNIALQNSGDRLIIVGLVTMGVLPSMDILSTARRIEVTIRSEARCCCTKPPCSRILCLNQHPRSPGDLSLDEEYPHLEALLFSGVPWFEQKLPEHAPALRLLSWSLIDQCHGTNYSTLSNLKHLFLKDVRHDMLKTIVGDIFMPKVTMLWLDFFVGVNGNLGPCTILTGWRFPKLQRLMLSGACQEEMWSDIKGLITACRMTIRELGVTVRLEWDDMEYSPCQNPLDEVLENLPNLATFRVAQLSVWEELLPSSFSIKPTWSLLLFGTLAAFGNSRTSAFETIVLGYGVKKVIFDSTWKDIYVTMGLDNKKYNSKVLRNVWASFGIMEKEGIIVCDIDGIRSSESHGRHFLSWLTSQVEMSEEPISHSSLAGDTISNIE